MAIRINSITNDKIRRGSLVCWFKTQCPKYQMNLTGDL